LDATLLVARYNRGGLLVEVLGDGVVVVRFRNGGWTTFTIDFLGSDNFPFYPWLTIIPYSKLEALAKKNGISEWKRQVTVHTSWAEEPTIWEENVFSSTDKLWKYHLINPADLEVESVTLFSDGITSSVRGADPQLYLEATDFKVKTACFLQRRMQKFEKAHKFNDDLSAASILFKE
jgi:hypothetical protein